LELNATFVFLLPTPARRRHFLSHVLPACTRIGQALRHKAAFIVVLTSTVLPGSTEGEVKRMEENAGQGAESFGLCYSPEFVALGSVIRGLLIQICPNQGI
jgi:UDPglucose 6-dehydrogenase